MGLQNVKHAQKNNYQHLSLNFEPEYSAVWVKFRYPGRPCMSIDLLEDFSKAQSEISMHARKGYEDDSPQRLRYQILSSSHPGVFNLGGDLDYFLKQIRSGNRVALFDYAKACIDILYASITGYGLPFTTIALVQSEALGGGFEAALSANVLIAERSAKFGFPETVFGMFPGMGAFSFLARRLTPGIAKRVIASGKVYTAEELYEMGVVDQLVADGRGVAAVHDHIRYQQSRTTGFEGLDRVVEQYNPITYKELIDVVTIWVDTAMQLSEKNLRLMEYLLNAQEKRWQSSTPSTLGEMHQVSA